MLEIDSLYVHAHILPQAADVPMATKPSGSNLGLVLVHSDTLCTQGFLSGIVENNWGFDFVQWI